MGFWRWLLDDEPKYGQESGVLWPIQEGECKLGKFLTCTEYGKCNI